MIKAREARAATVVGSNQARNGERNRRWFFRDVSWKCVTRTESTTVRAINPRIPVCGSPARLTGRCDSKLQWEFDGGFTAAYLAARNTNRAAYDAPNNNILSRNFWYLLYRLVKLSRWSAKAIMWRVSRVKCSFQWEITKTSRSLRVLNSRQKILQLPMSVFWNEKLSISNEFSATGQKIFLDLERG